MADLSDKDSSQTIKIVGASTTGLESNYASVSANQDLQISDISNTSGVQGTLNVSTTAVAVRVGGSNLADRKLLTVYNNSNAIVYFGYTNAVTTATGTPLAKQQFASFAIGPNLTLYLIAGSGTNEMRITECG